jgi:hypothetical protein
MTPEEFDQAEHYWVDKEATSKRMPKKPHENASMHSS